MFVGEAISWRSSKQSLVASTMEPEFISWFEATLQVDWLKSFISGLGVVGSISKLLRIYRDNCVLG